MGVVTGTANAALGEVGVVVDGRTYILRFGSLELIELEKRWEIEGLEAIYEQGVKRSNSRFTDFARVALSRHHGELTVNEVADLLDYREGDGDDRTRPVVEAVMEAFAAACPKKRAATEKTPVAAVKEVKGGRSR